MRQTKRRKEGGKEKREKRGQAGASEDFWVHRFKSYAPPSLGRT